MGEWVVRAMRLDEAEQVHALFDDRHRRASGRQFPLTVQRMRDQFSGPDRDPALDLTTVELDGVPVAHSVVYARAPYTEVVAFPAVAVDLSAADADQVMRLLVDRLELAARARVGDGSEAEGEHALAVELFDGETDLAASLTGLGFRLARRAFEMEMELPRELAPPLPPPGVTLRRWDPARDREGVVSVLVAAFRDHHGDAGNEESSAHFLDRADIRDDQTFVAEDDEGPVGVVVSLDRGDTGYVSSLGVLRRGRGLGVGRALLQGALAGFVADGLARAALDVDAENLTGATRLYESVGMRPVVVYALWLRPLTR
jgi:GNAT superfamily N-acetyltransferase